MARQPRGAVQAPTRPAPAKTAPTKAAAPKLSGQMITVPRGDREYRIPAEVYEGQDPDLTTEDVITLTDAAERDQGDGAVALSGVAQLLTSHEQLRADLNAERRARKELERTVLALAAALETQDRTIEVKRSEALAQQQSELAGSIANAGAVRVDLDNAAERLRREAENAEARIASAANQAAAPAEAARGSAKAAVVLVNEAAGAIDSKIASLEQSRRALS